MVDSKFEGRLKCVEDFLKATDKLIKVPSLACRYSQLISHYRVAGAP